MCVIPDTFVYIITPHAGRNYTEFCDVFSFGIIVWEMITRERPFLGSKQGLHNDMAILYAMANGMF